MAEKFRVTRLFGLKPYFVAENAAGLTTLVHANQYDRSSHDGQKVMFVGEYRRMIPDVPQRGDELICECRSDHRGRYAKSWCFVAEWQETENRLQADQRRAKEREAAAKRAEEGLAVATKQRAEAHPQSLAEALAHGWMVASQNGKQVIIHRVDERGKKLSRTLYPLLRLAVAS